MTVMTCFAFSGWHEILSEHTKALLRSRWTQDYGQKILWQNGKHRLRKSAPLAVSHLDEKEMMLCCFRDDALVAKLCPTLVTPWVVAHQAPLSMGFSRQEYWSGLPFPSPRYLPDPGVEPRSSAWQANSLSLSHLGSLLIHCTTREVPIITFCLVKHFGWDSVCR